MTLHTHICFGDPGAHLKELERRASSKRAVDWTIVSRAVPGDRAVFYMKAPMSSFVAVGTVITGALLEEDDDNWRGYYMSYIDDIYMLPSPTHLHDAQFAFPRWAWLRQPRRSTTIPCNIADRFLKFLEEPRPTTKSDIEGLRREVLRLSTVRSKKLRDAALHKANGRCSVCDRDFSKVLGGRGARVLQVHHRKQLSSYDTPRLNTVSDLAVVCANCHILLHLAPKKPLPVGKLRAMLKIRRRA